MAIDDRFRDQVRLLVQVLPVVAKEQVFALKGGTAINLFVREMPRLSVDIDLAFVPTVPREEALKECAEALERIANGLQERLGVKAERQTNRSDELRVMVQHGQTRIKIEVSPVLRGTVHPPVTRDVVASVEDEFGFASMPVVSLADLYGGKICAALDRQHPRDWFDIMHLLDSGDYDRSIFLGFIVYLLGHPRPLNEVLFPRWKPMQDIYEKEFVGMLREEVLLTTLEQTRERLLSALSAQLTEQDMEFMLSFKAGEPRWELFPLEGVRDLPAVKWKLQNIAKMPRRKHAEAQKKLRAVLEKMKAGELPEP
jgi:hypothetical protein